MFRCSVLIGNISWSIEYHLISVLSTLFNEFFQMHTYTEPRSTGTFALNNPPPTVLRNITLSCHLHVFMTTGAAYHANIRDSTTSRGHYKAKPLRISTRKHASIKIKKRLSNFNKRSDVNHSKRPRTTVHDQSTVRDTSIILSSYLLTAQMSKILSCYCVNKHLDRTLYFLGL